MSTTLFHDDVNRRHRLNRIPLQACLTVNCAEKRAAELIVHRRERKNLNIVHHRRNSFDTLHRCFRVGF
ncbi:MAG: hypothetical protein AUH86_01760 [Acidobacteria bacterium 13_1_40CM_4_58_4]|nr:MAG: hypothetical protein AUH86_01760 [Acidobacteria bacterium 13_1_40CM_4_58_4]